MTAFNDSPHIGEITWVEYARRVKEEYAPVLVPVASTEQHGPHTPLGCDAIVGMEIATKVAEQVGALVAPTLSYGYYSQPRTGGGNHFPGNICVSGEVISSLTCDLVRSFAEDGVRNICFLNSHYENSWFIIEGIQEALENTPKGLRVICMNYFEMGQSETVEKVFGDKFISWEIEHGAVMTTSILMHRRPDFVRTDLIPDHQPVVVPPYDVFPFDPNDGSKSGAMSASTIASAENGKLFFDDFVSGISNALLKEFELGDQR